MRKRTWLNSGFLADPAQSRTGERPSACLRRMLPSQRARSYPMPIRIAELITVLLATNCTSSAPKEARNDRGEPHACRYGRLRRYCGV